MKLNIEVNFDGLASCFEDYEYARNRVWTLRKKMGYRKNECVWMSTAPKEFREAVTHCDAKAEGTNALWYTSHKLYKAVAQTRRLDKKYMIKNGWQKCLKDSSLERLMAYYTKEG